MKPFDLRRENQQKLDICAKIISKAINIVAALTLVYLNTLKDFLKPFRQLETYFTPFNGKKSISDMNSVSKHLSFIHF